MPAERRAPRRRVRHNSPVTRALVALSRVVSCTQLFNPQLNIVRQTVQVRDLPSELEGFCLAQVSDLHIGRGAWGPCRFDEVLQALRDVGPDVLVNTGDFFQETPPLERVRTYAEQLRIERKPEITGPVNLAMLGNHDYYEDDESIDALEAMLEELGVELLLNRCVTVERNGVPITFFGLTMEHLDFAEASQRLKGTERPRIVVTHEPDVVEHIPHGSADLVVAGHTHGGQITLPFLTPLIVRVHIGSRYVAGRYRVNGNPLYINRGLGTTGLPVRVGVKPELTFFTLTR